MGEIRIEYYGPKWEDAHIKFATKYFNGRRKRIHPTYLYWKFRGEQQKELESFLLAVDGEKVIGQLGLVPCLINIAEVKFEAQWACDLMVDNSYRGKGVASKLYEKAVDAKITLGSDPSLKASVSMKRFGFKEMKGPVKTFLPIRIAAITDKKVKSLSKFIGKFKNPLVYPFGKNSDWLVSKEINISEIDIKEIEALKEKTCVSIEHDNDFYSWRLSSFKDYQKNGRCFYSKGEFFVVLRISNSLLFVNDLFAPDQAVFNRVLDCIIGFAKKNGISEVKWMENSDERLKVLKRKGFISYKTRTKIIYYSKDIQFNRLMGECENFYYNSLDSDENI